MCKKYFSLLLVLFITVNTLFTSFIFLFEFLKINSINYNTTSAVMLNFSKYKNIPKGFIDICSNVSDMFAECNKNDKTTPVINKKETSATTFPVIFDDKIIVNSMWQYKYNLYDVGFSKIFSSIKKHIVDKPDRTDNIFLLLLLQILIYLIVLNMCKYFINFYLNINKITPSILAV